LSGKVASNLAPRLAPDIAVIFAVVPLGGHYQLGLRLRPGACIGLYLKDKLKAERSVFGHDLRML
jgi:hypothetical protein